MTPLKYAIIIGTIREGRFGDKPASWLAKLAEGRKNATYDIVDLRDHLLPLFAETVSPMRGPSANPAGQLWRETLAKYDGFVFITAEYNHGISGVLKNALDYPYPELNEKPAAFLAYGGVGGARAVEQLRLICIELQMAPLRDAVHIGMPDFGRLAKGDVDFSQLPHLGNSADVMLEQLERWGRALAEMRRR